MKFTIAVKTPDDLARIAREIGRELIAGDTILLAGPVGAGKSHFARALIQDRLQALGRSEDVPSPSFTLVQTYDLDSVALWHVDLYRLGSASEVLELGLDEAFDDAICLVEWPDRLAADLPERFLEVDLSIPDPRSETRCLKITARGEKWDEVSAALRSLQYITDEAAPT